ncbi:hypothetical protein GCM10009802_28000 [Streptomyces synnematoformans]|uniref:PLD phosphodiesterase domain-containing protein n=1 Tax=Streptomyces synnematoformans TaxID=415721 RepID=A0ABN2Y924_9ACTN
MEDEGGALAVVRIREGWTGPHGRAVEPARRPAPGSPRGGRLLDSHQRRRDRYLGADRTPLLFLGSINWLEQSPFDRHNLAALDRHRAALTDEPVPVVAVPRSGVESPGLDTTYGPGDSLIVWPL